MDRLARPARRADACINASLNGIDSQHGQLDLREVLRSAAYNVPLPPRQSSKAEPVFQVDIEDKFRAYPLLATAFMLSCVLGVALLLAFVMQWNQYSLFERSVEGFKREKKQLGFLRAAVKWFFVGGFLSTAEIWRKSKGIRFIAPLGVGFCLFAWALFRVLVSL